MAMSLVHGGSGFPFIAPYIFRFFCNPCVTEIHLDVDDIPDLGAKMLTEKVLYK